MKNNPKFWTEVTHPHICGQCDPQKDSKDTSYSIDKCVWTDLWNLNAQNSSLRSEETNKLVLICAYRHVRVSGYLLANMHRLQVAHLNPLGWLWRRLQHWPLRGNNIHGIRDNLSRGGNAGMLASYLLGRLQRLDSLRRNMGGRLARVRQTVVGASGALWERDGGFINAHWNSNQRPIKFSTHDTLLPSHSNSLHRTSRYIHNLWTGLTRKCWWKRGRGGRASRSNSRFIFLSFMQWNSLGQLISPDGKRNPPIL